MTTSDECHIQITIDGHILHYRAHPVAALGFAAAAPTIGARATIDDDLRAGLRQLPCQQLWMHPG